MGKEAKNTADKQTREVFAKPKECSYDTHFCSFAGYTFGSWQAYFITFFQGMLNIQAYAT